MKKPMAVKTKMKIKHLFLNMTILFILFGFLHKKIKKLTISRCSMNCNSHIKVDEPSTQKSLLFCYSQYRLYVLFDLIAQDFSHSIDLV